MGVGPLLYKRVDASLQLVSNAVLTPATSRVVCVLPRGAEVDGAGQNGVSTITVKAGHGVATGQKFMVGTDTAKFFTAGTTTATTIPLSTGTVTVTDGDAIVNLGADTGTTSPNFDDATVPIYSRASTTTALSPSTVTSNSTTAKYEYWSTERLVWEVVLLSGAPDIIVRDAELERVEEVVDVREVSAGPTAPTTSDRVRLYMRNENLIYQYYNGTTSYYHYLPLDKYAVSWSAVSGTEPS